MTMRSNIPIFLILVAIGTFFLNFPIIGTTILVFIAFLDLSTSENS